MAYPHVQPRQTHSNLAGCGSEIIEWHHSLFHHTHTPEQPVPSPSSPPAPNILVWPRGPLSHRRKSLFWAWDPTASQIAPPARSREWNSGSGQGSLRKWGGVWTAGRSRGMGSPPPRPPTGSSELPRERCWWGQGLTGLRGWAGPRDPAGGGGTAGRQQRESHQH